MECLTEKSLELLVLTENRKPGGDSATWEHIAVCAFCADRFRQLHLFYKTFYELYERPGSAAEIRFADRMKSSANPHVYVAYPYELPKQTTTVESFSPVLAASSGNWHYTAPFENLGVLATDDRKVIVRVMKTIESGAITLHLISDDEDRYKHVIVRVPSIAREFTSDENGKVQLGKTILPNTKDMFVEVQTPRATFDLTSLDLQKDQLIAQTEVVLTNERNDSIRVEFIPAELHYTLKVHLLKLSGKDDKKRLRVMVVRGTKGHLIKAVQQGVAVFQRLKDNGELKIRIFD